MGRYGLRAVPSAAPGRPTTALVDGKIALVDDGAGIAPALQARLAEGGVTAEVVRAADASHTGVIFLPGLADFADVDAAASVNHAAFVAARALAVSANGGLTGPFITVSDLGGAFGTAGAATNRGWSAGLTGLVRTAAIEWPGTTVRAIDLERGGRSVDDIATALANELLGGGDDREVGLAADGSRTTLQSEEVEVAPGQLPLGADDVVVVSGGARGVTAATVIELAKASGASFVLLGRTALVEEADGLADAADDASLKRALLTQASTGGTKVTPSELSREAARVLANREILATLDAVVTAGGSARYVAVDITDHAAVSATLDTVRAEIGPITGVIHGAGVLADKLIAEKTDEQFARVFATKVDGLRALLDATADDALKVLCLFSSVAARTGNQGQVDYAMANEILNKVAVAERLRRGETCVVKSLGWGPWAGGMVSPALEAHFASMGVRLIPLDVGARMLVDELASPQTDEVELVLGGAVLPDADVANA